MVRWVMNRTERELRAPQGWPGERPPAVAITDTRKWRTASSFSLSVWGSEREISYCKVPADVMKRSSSSVCTVPEKDDVSFEHGKRQPSAQPEKSWSSRLQCAPSCVSEHQDVPHNMVAMGSSPRCSPKAGEPTVVCSLDSDDFHLLVKTLCSTFPIFAL